MRYAVFLLLAFSALGQQKFEVASIKERPQNVPVQMVGSRPSGSNIRFEAMSLADLVSFAYNVKSWQVTGGPSWTGVQKDRSTLDASARRFDIVAKAEGDSARALDEFRQMTVALLSDRFHLAVHREPRDTPVYALVKDKNGPKLKERDEDSKSFLRMNGGGNVTGSGATIQMLAGWFSNANGVDRPVLDQTGLAGHYDFTLEWSNVLGSDSTAPSIFAALPEQLGLRLEPKHAPVEFLVIDRAELPDRD